MAALTWFGTNTVLNSQFQEMSETSPGADATSSPQMGWVVGTGAGVDYASMDAGTNVTAATFGATVQPDGSLVTGSGSNGDGFRSTNKYTGNFASANWVWHGVVIGVTNSGAQDGHVDIRLFRGPNVDGTGATQITSAVQTGSTITNLSTTQADSTVTFNPGAFSVENEYIFVQVAWVRTGAGGMTTTDVAFRYGTTATRMVSASFVKAVAAGSGTFNETGTAATLKYGRLVGATSGSIAETGTAATLKAGRLVSATSGSVAETGTAAGLRAARTFAAASGAIAETGTSATLKVGRLVAAGSGPFTETGTAAGLRTARVLPSPSGSIAETGTAATLVRGLNLSASAGSFVEIGTAATLTYTPIGSGYTLTAAAGSIAETGSAATLKVGRAVVADSGSVSETGTAAGFVVLRRISADAASYTMSGAAVLTAGRRIAAAGSSIALTGTAATLDRVRKLVAANGAILLTGAASLEYDRIFVVAGDALTVAGSPVTMKKFHPDPQHRSHAVAPRTVERSRRVAARWMRIRRR